MDENKIIAYSFLAHLNNDNVGNGFNDIFIPLVRRTLSKLCNNNKFMGQITDIKEKFKELYGIDIPYPILREMLKRISIEINKSKKGKMVIYRDDAYCIEKYTFEDYEETIQYKKYKIEKLDEIFKKYIEDKALISQYEGRLDIFKFIDRNRTRLSTFLSSDLDNVEEIEKNADIEMDFIKEIRKTDIESYNTLKDIYIGSIISTYIEIDKIDSQTEKMKFIVDTNFIISLLGLHSEESKDTCNKIVDICKKVGYKILISDYTIDEANHILLKIIEGIDTNTIERFRYNSAGYICDKNDITKTDLELKQRRLNEFIAQKGISIVFLKSKYKNESIIKNSEIYKKLEETSYVDTNSILHDAILIDYVSNERAKNAKTFSDMKIWFLTESKKLTYIKSKYNYSEAITTIELVNLLWLMKPTISSEDIFKLGLSNLFAEVIESKQPNKKIIRAIDNNIKKYKGKINDDDIIALGLVVSNSSINSLKDMNKSYEEINEYLKEKEFNEFSKKIKTMKEEQDKLIEEQRKKELLKIEEQHKKENNDKFLSFINILIINDIKNIQEENNKLEYESMDIKNISKRNSDKINKATNFTFRTMGLIIGIVLIIFKNASQEKFITNFVDLLIFVAPIALVELLRPIVQRVNNFINDLVNKKRNVRIKKIRNIMGENNKNIEILNEIKEKLLGSTNIKRDIIELSKQNRYCNGINKLNLLTYIDEQDINEIVKTL